MYSILLFDICSGSSGLKLLLERFIDFSSPFDKTHPCVLHNTKLTLIVVGGWGVN